MSDSLFVDPQYRKEIGTIYPTHNFSINIDHFGIKSRKLYNVTVDGILSRHLLIRISDPNDLAKIFICTIDMPLFEHLKVEQSLHVTFDELVTHLSKILDACKKQELNLAMSRDQSQHILQFYEERSLRNFVILYLPIQDAPQSVIMFHTNQSIENFQQQNESLSEQVDRLENALHHRDQQIGKLEDAAVKKRRRSEEEHAITLHEQLKQTAESKDAVVGKLNSSIQALQANNEFLKVETVQLTDKVNMEPIQDQKPEDDSHEGTSRRDELEVDGSLKALTESIKAAPNNRKLYVARAAVYKSKNLLSLALTDMEKVHELSEEVISTLNKAEVEHREVEKAAEDIAKDENVIDINSIPNPILVNQLDPPPQPIRRILPARLPIINPMDLEK